MLVEFGRARASRSAAEEDQTNATERDALALSGKTRTPAKALLLKRQIYTR